MTCCIYKIENVDNGKKYVGSAVDYKRRIRRHTRALKDNNHRNQHLQRSWDKHGPASFLFNRLLICEKNELYRYEQLLIDILEPEYNMARSVSQPFLGRKHKESTKKKMSDWQKGATKYTAEQRNQIARRMQDKSKLTPNDVIEIRRLYSLGVMQSALAKMFLSSRATICRIVNRKSWRNI